MTEGPSAVSTQTSTSVHRGSVEMRAYEEHASKRILRVARAENAEYDLQNYLIKTVREPIESVNDDQKCTINRQVLAGMAVNLIHREHPSVPQSFTRQSIPLRPLSISA